MWESIVLATSFGRGQLRKQFCVPFAEARFHTAWVKAGKAQCEQMSSAVASIADIAQRSQHVRFVPIADIEPSMMLDELAG